MSPREKLSFWTSLQEKEPWKEYLTAMNDRINQDLINSLKPIKTDEALQQEWGKGFTAGMMHALATIEGMMESLRLDVTQENQNVQAPTNFDE